MNKRNQLITITNLVKTILETDPQTRNSDSLLYLKVLEHISVQKGLDLNALTVPAFLCSMKELGVPCFETVRRTRQKVQREHPELSANKKVQAYREINEAIFREFARE